MIGLGGRGQADSATVFYASRFIPKIPVQALDTVPPGPKALGHRGSELNDSGCSSTGHHEAMPLG